MRAKVADKYGSNGGEMTILVTGATGNVGWEVVRQLVAAGVKVRAMTRNPATANFPDSVEVVQGDLTQAEGWPAILEGVEKAFLFPVAGAFVDMAKAAGVKRIVVLSSAALDYEAEDMSGYSHAPERAIERAVEVSGLEWTHVRPGEFMSNALEWVGTIRAESVVRAPFGDSPGVPIHEADIAVVAVKALLEDGHNGAIYSVTGSEFSTLRERVQTISRAIGRDIRFEELTPQQARENWRANGYPDEVIDWLLNETDQVVDYDLPSIFPTFERVMGRPARTFAEWAVDHAADFR
jgi:uncharacterized protein YbjT (DUF2867 family)